MLYTFFIRLLNNHFFKRVIRKTSKIILQKDITDDNFDMSGLIKKYSKGKSFADIGALWGVHGKNTFLAEEFGANRSVAVDVYPETKEFIEEKNKRKSKVEFIEGDINIPDVLEKIGKCDTVLCSGVAYHTPDPVHLFMQLRSVTKETLLLNSASIPEIPFMKNFAVFYPFLDKKQRKIWNRHIGSQKSITGPYEPDEGYANWFWGMTPSAIESMLNCAGFEVVERYVFFFRIVYVCRATQIKFTPESGKWTTPKDKDFLLNKQ